MRKVTAVILSVILCMTMLCACGRKTDQNGNTLITSKWTIAEYTVNGEHEDLRDDSLLIKLIMFKDKPRFKSTDGKSFEFSLLQKHYSGALIKQDDGLYEMSTGKGSSLYARIEGNQLIIYDEAGKMEMVFETS